MDKGLIFAPRFGKAIVFKQPQLTRAGGGQAADPAAAHLIAHLGTRGLAGGLGSRFWSTGDALPGESTLPAAQLCLLLAPAAHLGCSTTRFTQEPFGSPRIDPRVAAGGSGCQGREPRGQQEKREVGACAGRHQDLALVLPASCQRFKLHEQAPATRKRLMTYGFRASSKWEKSSLRLHGIRRISTPFLVARVLQEGWSAEGTGSGGCSNLSTISASHSWSSSSWWD